MDKETLNNLESIVKEGKPLTSKDALKLIKEVRDLQEKLRYSYQQFYILKGMAISACSGVYQYNNNDNKDIFERIDDFIFGG